MEKFNLNKMIGGWFVGDFEPTIYKTKNCEVAYKKYKKGDYEKKHLHKIATEITLIAKGKVKMNNIEYKEGDIILIKPNEATDFFALEECSTVVVKIPSVKGDKYVI